jgi:hemerythrin-like domain-containing protein
VGVIAALAKEHAVFLRMIGRIERALAWSEAAGRMEVRESLLVFLPALDEHERIEDVVFADPAYASAEGADRIRAELAREHGRVDLMRAEIRLALENAECPWDAFKNQVAELTRKLRLHLAAEEKRLWPHYARTMSRSRDRSAARRVDRETDRLEREIASNRRSVDDYLEGRR